MHLLFPSAYCIYKVNCHGIHLCEVSAVLGWAWDTALFSHFRLRCNVTVVWNCTCPKYKYKRLPKAFTFLYCHLKDKDKTSFIFLWMWIAKNKLFFLLCLQKSLINKEFYHNIILKTAILPKSLTLFVFLLYHLNCFYYLYYLWKKNDKLSYKA